MRPPPPPKIFVTIGHKKDQYTPHPLAVTYFLNDPFGQKIWNKVPYDIKSGLRKLRAHSRACA